MAPSSLEKDNPSFPLPEITYIEGDIKEFPEDLRERLQSYCNSKRSTNLPRNTLNVLESHSYEKTGCRERFISIIDDQCYDDLPVSRFQYGVTSIITVVQQKDGGTNLNDGRPCIIFDAGGRVTNNVWNGKRVQTTRYAVWDPYNLKDISGDDVYHQLTDSGMLSDKQRNHKNAEEGSEGIVNETVATANKRETTDEVTDAASQVVQTSTESAVVVKTSEDKGIFVTPDKDQTFQSDVAQTLLPQILIFTRNSRAKRQLVPTISELRHQQIQIACENEQKRKRSSEKDALEEFDEPYEVVEVDKAGHSKPGRRAKRSRLTKQEEKDPIAFVLKRLIDAPGLYRKKMSECSLSQIFWNAAFREVLGENKKLAFYVRGPDKTPVIFQNDDDAMFEDLKSWAQEDDSGCAKEIVVTRC